MTKKKKKKKERETYVVNINSNKPNKINEIYKIFFRCIKDNPIRLKFHNIYITIWLYDMALKRRNDTIFKMKKIKEK